MAKRSPLGTSANFTVKPFNPAETEFHSYWGVYLWDASAAANSIGGRSGATGTKKLPNEQNNPLASPEWDKLRIGDIAGTAESQAVSDGSAVPAIGDDEGLFVCIYAGTVGGGNAVWVRLDNDNLATQTVRDAHVIVVAQSTRLATLSNNPSGDNAANNFNLTPAVGDVASITCDYLDPGTGTQLELALLAAASAQVGIDIRLRPCSISISGIVAAFLVLPQDCRLIGGGRHVSEIVGKTTGSQVVIQMGANSELIDLAVTSPDATSTSGTGSNGIIETAGTNTRLKNLLLTSQTTNAVARNARAMFWDATATAQVLDCTFVGSSQVAGSLAAFPVVAVVMGDWTTAVSQTTPAQNFEVCRCHFEGSSPTSSWQQLLLSYNVIGLRTGLMYDCDGVVARPRFEQLGGIGVTWPTTGAPVANVCALPRFTNIRLLVADVEGADVVYAGLMVSNARNTQKAGFVAIRGVQIAFLTTTNTIPRIGIWLWSQNGANIEGGAITDAIVGNHTVGIELEATGAGSSLNNIRVTGADVNAPVTTGASTGRGIMVDSSDNVGTVSAIGIQNCVAQNIPVGGFGIDVTATAVSNTIVIGNNLTPAPGTGTALGDFGTGTEIAHNILV